MLQMFRILTVFQLRVWAGDEGNGESTLKGTDTHNTVENMAVLIHTHATAAWFKKLLLSDYQSPLFTHLACHCTCDKPRLGC